MTPEQEQAIAIASARARMAAAQKSQPVASPDISTRFGIPQPSPERKRIQDVSRNAIVEGVASLPDSIFNTPSNIWNLGKAAYGTARTAMGNPDAAPEVSMPPNYINRFARHVGLTTAAGEPETSKEKLLAAALRGGAGMALAPGAAIPNMAAGVASGVAGEGVTQATGSPMAGLAASLATPFAMQAGKGMADQKIAALRQSQQRNAVEDATLRAGQQAGYVLPPSHLDQGGVKGWINRRLEGFAGKADVNQDVNGRNQAVTNSIAANELSFPPNTAITESRLDQFRDAAARPYRDVVSLPTLPPPRVTGIRGYPLFGKTPDSPAQALHDLKETRLRATDHWREFDRTGSVTAKDAATAASNKAAQLESDIEKAAIAGGRPDLVDELRNARTQIAKSHDIERALNVGNSDVSAPIIGRALDKGKPFTGGLDTVGRFAEAFPQHVREGARVPTPGVSKMEVFSMAGLAALGGGALGPAGVAMGAIPLLSTPTRAMILSKPYQKIMATRNYDPSTLSKLLSETSTVNKDAAYRAALIGALRTQQAGDQ